MLILRLHGEGKLLGVGVGNFGRKKTPFGVYFLFPRRGNNGRGGGIRTHDHLVPNQVRYRAALRPD
jgi:hypothetical protein